MKNTLSTYKGFLVYLRNRIANETNDLQLSILYAMYRHTKYKVDIIEKHILVRRLK